MVGGFIPRGYLRNARNCSITNAGRSRTEAWPAPVMVGSCKYRVPGQTVGQKLYFRIAVFRSNGQGQWSDIVSVTVK